MTDDQRPESPETDAAARPDLDGPTRLRRVLTRRPGRGQATAAVLLAVLGFAAAVQIQLTRDDSDFSGQRRQELVLILDGLAGTVERAESQLADLEQTRDELRTSSDRRQLALEEAEERLTVLGILAGTLPAVGPGVTITIDDPDGVLRAATLLNGIEELRGAGGGEAIEINDTVRVVASTSFTDEDSVISVDGTELQPPYVIDVIGSPHTLSEAVTFPGGFADGVARDGATLEVTESDVVEVGSLHTIEPPEYAQPTDD
jgi:uncharacterized protein YlxW (UPF0749 family)